MKSQLHFGYFPEMLGGFKVRGKEGKKIQNFEYFENEKSFFNEKALSRCEKPAPFRIFFSKFQEVLIYVSFRAERLWSTSSKVLGVFNLGK